VPLLYGAYEGFKKGFLVAISTFFSIILGVILAFAFTQKGVAFLQQHIHSRYLPEIAFILILIAVVVGIFMLSKTLKSLINLTPFGNIDDLVGAFFGIAKWCLILSLFFWLIEESDFRIPTSYTSHTIIYPYFIRYGVWVIDNCSQIFPFGKDLMQTITDQLKSLQ
jgi:membrane protein required for colicin V production